MSTLRSGQAINAPALTSRAFADLSDAPTPEAGKALGWDANGVLANIVTPSAHETTWLDVPSDAIQAATGTTGLTIEQYRSTGVLCLKMRHDQDDTLHLRPEMPHGWVVDSECRMHLHYTPHVTPVLDQVVRIQYQYCWAHVNAEVPDVAGWTTGFTDIAIPASGADTFKKKLVSIFSTTPTGGGPASILLARITRLSSSASDTFTTGSATGTQAANFVVWAVGLHVQVNRSGTLTETA